MILLTLTSDMRVPSIMHFFWGIWALLLKLTNYRAAQYPSPGLFQMLLLPLCSSVVRHVFFFFPAPSWDMFKHTFYWFLLWSLKQTLLCFVSLFILRAQLTWHISGIGHKTKWGHWGYLSLWSWLVCQFNALVFGSRDKVFLKLYKSPRASKLQDVPSEALSG